MAVVAQQAWRSPRKKHKADSETEEEVSDVHSGDGPWGCLGWNQHFFSDCFPFLMRQTESLNETFLINFNGKING